ncbi:MAG TPA: serine/threonine-protein kinase [Kofleriaceae bacterium]|nr:serine/threonine-protein kinase [Kofleriaceae bacterium]
MKLCPKCQKQFSDDANFCPVDAARLVPLETQTAGADALAARFELGVRLGGSRTGVVHRATDKTTGKACVVKLIAPAVTALPGVSQRLERELKQLERVNSAGVAKVLASGKRGDESWVALELLDGAQTLAEAISARGPIPAERAADLIELIGEALIEAAQVGVVHRDLAPKNVLFAGSDVKLVNFSLPVPTSDKVPGVPEFVSPEQVDGRAVDQRSNLYSLGALYYYVLTGQAPFTGSADEVHRQHASGTIRPPSQLMPVPPQVEAVILRALDRSPTKRFLTVRQFVDEVTRVGHGEVIELKQTMAMGRANKPKGELVQTLMGIRGGLPASAQVPQPMVAAAPAQVVAGVPLAQAPTAAVPAAPVVPQRAPTNPVVPSTVVGVVAPTVHGVPSAPGAPVAPAAASPWAAPAAQPAPPVIAPPVVAPPVVAAPVVAAPVLAAQPAAPVVAAAPAGKKKPVDEQKGKFRETMWFKKGDLDAQAAQAAAEERMRTGKLADSDRADSLPIDERYKDDGSITRGDKEKYSLRTGGTQMMPAIDERGARTDGKVSEDALIGEMKRGRGVVIIFAVAAIMVALIIYLMFR